MQLESPCYDRIAKKDCPRRHEGCAVNCPEWAKYCERRNEVYGKNKANYESLVAIYDNRHRQSNKKQRKNIAARQNKVRRR